MCKSKVFFKDYFMARMFIPEKNQQMSNGQSLSSGGKLIKKVEFILLLFTH